SENQFITYILNGQPEPPLYFGRMKKINKAGPAILKSLPKPAKTTIEQLTQSNATIIDTRNRQQFMKRHLPDSLLISNDKNFSTIAGCYIDPQSDICLVTNEAEVEQAVRHLVHVGLDNIRGYVITEDLGQ